ncbi:5-oxoprolinase subunit PxpB [Flavobacterium sp. CS20]|jgi:inhibitor of KinA|uniref:5-oxoprolinase subunit PxpB n=1 Tax=Flavobacterium sp. CS20 TaxID=2775246 RepID=UPI001B3A1CF1|nr:5-oxoprolinase subunit PxpB [Flavobacterium sp. CS20]QTY27243.1 5-oxoprolinase subunit PxpB [Flavobacterium sp. CS20]
MIKKELNDFKTHLSSPTSLLVEWNFKLSAKYIKTLQALKNQLLKQDQDIKYITSAFNTFLIKYKNSDIDILKKKNQTETFINSFEIKNNGEVKTRRFKIPVCYEYEQDLKNISKQKNLSTSKIIQIHTEQIYTLYFIGFLPGFLYLGDVDKRIQIPRHQTPRQNVEKGSVGIAENQTGIYPMRSPGGWQIVGQTPIDLFDVNRKPPSPFHPGDQIQFFAIDKSEFDRLKNADISIEKFKQND